MDYTPVTPFRRTIDAAILKHQAATQEELPPTGANKWEILRELAAARVAFGLSDRDLTVLQVLVSFHQATILGDNDSEFIVHPSNKAICERLNGMPCSTMRRHLSNLVQAGFVVRRDSPNGKRYARRYGGEKIAFGFDLSPLVRRFQEICEVAEAVRAAEERYKRLRATVSLMRRDLAGLAEYGSSLRPELGVWDQFSDLAVLTGRDLRRKLEMADLKRIEEALGAALDQARDLLEGNVAENMSINDAISEHHHQNSNKDLYDLEPRVEKARGEGEALGDTDVEVNVNRLLDKGNSPGEPEDQLMPNIPLGLVLASCQEFKSYAEETVRHWHDLVRVADIIRPMMGISPSAWDEAKRYMGPEEASVVVVAMLERFGEIRSPGGYLRSLSAKAAIGEFSCGPMIMALMRRDAA
ncbi:replication initiator RepC [Pseudooceanicola batsensis HTCC2597]|uniref:Replication initiator RepC n=1 Tax=Pseudooceanicola batsensis (strain ATCC BAA-863 / DSM 15984 / KCTC 12145 / HTCC2597) TaxID=252305 RepID=A3TZY9_PSEBH|nr:plasmid replication protein RepC [Pseudooceanicola batsensis]EAQ02620.1 replication initiator RepC [Pseudooceanicola batsensis HTCC2597]